MLKEKELDLKTSVLAMADSTIQAMLWAVLCFALIRNFNLEGIWYVVCGVVLAVEIGLLFLHQRITFPGIISYLGYEPNEKLEEMKKFDLSEHLITVLVMYVVVYLCLKT